MTIELILVLAVTLLALVLFVTEALRVEVVALLVLSLLLVSGILTAEEGLQGFSNPATVTIGAMFVLSEGLRRTGTLNYVSIWLGRLFDHSFNVALLVMMIGAAVASAFINNVAVVAIMLPVMLGMCRRIHISPSRVLIPLSFAAMFGGSCTLIGTSSNLLVSSLIVEQGLEPIAMFEVTPLGVLFFLVGTIYLMTLGQWLLPDRGAETWRAEPLKEFRAQVEILAGHPYLGNGADRFFDSGDGDVIGVLREGVLLHSDLDKVILEPHDILRVSTDATMLRILDAEAHLRLLPLMKRDEVEQEEHDHSESELVEVVIAPDAGAKGKTLREAGFERYHPSLVIALRRAGKVVVDDLLDVVLHGGDVLLMQAPHEQLRNLQESDDFIVVSEVGVPTFKTKMTLPVILLLLAIVTLAALEVMPIVSLALIGCVILVLTRVLTAENAYKAIDWQVIFLLGGFIPLGTALQKTGAIELVAHGLVYQLGAYGPMMILAGFYFITNFLSDVISNQVMAVLMTPVALATALTLGVDPRPFVIAIAFAAANSFASPVGYHTNVMIYGAGNYRYLDFVKIGIPLNLLFLGTAVVALPLFWPF